MSRYIMILAALVSAVGCSGGSSEPVEQVPKVIYVPAPSDSSGKGKKADPVGSLEPIVTPTP